MLVVFVLLFFFSSRRRHTRWPRDWSSDVCSSDLGNVATIAHGAAPTELSRVMGNYEPARYVSPSSASNWAIQAVEADPDLAGTRLIQRRLGLSEGEIEEVRSDISRRDAPGVLSQLMSRSQDTSADDAGGAVDGGIDSSVE